MFKINTARKFRYNTVCLFVAYTLISMLTACKNPLLEIIKTEVEIAVTPPTISAYYPTTEATGIPSNAELSITFSKNIDPETVSSSTFPVTNQAGTPVGGRYTVQDSTITFTPTGGFALGASYNATITRNILDTDGRSISETFSWSFTTDLPADLEPPVLSSLSFSRANIYSISGLDWTGLLSHEVVISAADNKIGRAHV